MRAPGSDCSYMGCAAEEKDAPTVTVCPFGECRLRDVPDGVKTRVRALHGCRRLRSRLYSLGLTPGAEIVVHGHGDAGCRVEVRDTCLVLDGESAENIVCDDVTEPGALRPARGGTTLRDLFERRGSQGEKR